MGTKTGVGTQFTQKYILHADLDAFFASVEQRDNPYWRGQPVVVGGSAESRGVVAAASYEARKYGIKSAMPMVTALRRCPNLIRVSPRFDEYQRVSRQIMDIFKEFTQLVEPLSLDEAYLDITDKIPIQSPQTIAQMLKDEVTQHTHLTLSIGGGISKTVAKIASQIAKPNGLLLIHPDEVTRFLSPLSITLLPGVGPKSAAVLRDNDVTTLRDLSESDDIWLVKTFGKRGLEMKLHATGFDLLSVKTHRDTKSISSEVTMPIDIDDPSILMTKIDELTATVSTRLKSNGLQGRTISLKVRLDDFTTFTRQVTLPSTTNSDSVILGVARNLLTQELIAGRKFRLLGITIGNFADHSQLPLFE